MTIYKLVTKDTVDADIYEMQERKAKMNAAIMESNDSGGSNNKKERKVMLEALVNRFLTGPKRNKNNSTAVEIDAQKETCLL